MAKQLAGDGTIGDVTYTFDRRTDPMKLAVDGPGMKATGSISIDNKGFPTKLELTFSFGTVVITRQ